MAAGPSTSKTGEDALFSDYLAEIAPEGRTGKPLLPAISQIVNSVFRTKISDTKREEKLKLFEVPENCPGLDKVRTNQTMWDKLQPRTRTMDTKLQNIQALIVASGSGVCKALSTLHDVKAQNCVISKETVDGLIKDLLNVQVLIGQSNVDLNVRRRELFKPDLNDQYHPLCAASTPFTEWLFGDGLSDQVKDITEANKLCGRLFPGRGRFRGRASRGFRGRHHFQPRYQPYYQPYQSYGHSRGQSQHKRGSSKPFLGQASTPAKKKD